MALQMIKNIPLTFVAVFLFLAVMATAILRADTHNGIISLKSDNDVKTTIDRLESAELCQDNGRRTARQNNCTATAYAS